jgi:hypothetical protein
VLQDYRQLSDDELDGLEKQTMRVLVQAVQEYSREAREIFEGTQAAGESELIVLAEDLTQYALEVAECYPINKRFAGFIDYKRVRWLSSPYGLFPQVLLVDAKASKENSRTTLQQSQLSMDADFTLKGGARKGDTSHMQAGVPQHLDLVSQTPKGLVAVTTSAFVHFHYTELDTKQTPFRTLHAIYILLVPHQRLKPRYNPSATVSFFGEGKHSSGRGEEPRIRVYFDQIRRACTWRLQELRYPASTGFTTPEWRDTSSAGPVTSTFEFIGR